MRIICDSSALRSNFRRLKKNARGLSLIPMLKADAYGHGAVWAARVLQNEPGLHAIGVATFDEAISLREAYIHQPSVLVFSGASPWTEEMGRLCLQHRLTPVLADLEAWRTFTKQGWAGRVQYELKFNTGMNRLGLPLAAWDEVARHWRQNPAQSPAGLLTHLALGEAPGHPLSKTQIKNWVSLVERARQIQPEIELHFANSAAIGHAEKWKINTLSTAARPGISLYGIPPWSGAPHLGLRPVMTAEIQVISLRTLLSGEAIGYGARWRAPSKPKQTRIAILGAGYGDGIPRAGGGHAHVWLEGKLRPIVGVVSMDLLAAQCGEKTRTGHWAQWLGSKIDPWKQAAASMTLPYELLTSIGGTASARVARLYD